MKKRILTLQVIACLSLSAFAANPPSAGEEEIGRKIQPGDTIVIEVFGEENLTVTRRVQGGGWITYPLLKQVQVADQTTADVADVLTKKLGEKYLRNPEVSVTVKEYRSQTVTILGAVDFRTVFGGAIELPSEQRMDLLEALAKAGGISAKAGKNPKIELTRKGKITDYRFEDLRKETDPKKKIWLEPGDIIFVPEAFF